MSSSECGLKIHFWGMQPACSLRILTNTDAAKSNIDSINSIWVDVSVKSEVECQWNVFRTSRRCICSNTYTVSFVCHLFDIAVSSYCYQMHPRIDCNTDPRTSDTSSDSELSIEVCGMNVAKHTHSATNKFPVLFHWACVLIFQTSPPNATAGSEEERWIMWQMHGTAQERLCQKAIWDKMESGKLSHIRCVSVWVCVWSNSIGKPVSSGLTGRVSVWSRHHSLFVFS